MQIIINQADIHTAIRNFIMSQMPMANDTNIEIELKATRGDEGYTAVIEINPPKPPQGGKPKTISTAVTSGKGPDTTANAKSEAPKASTEVQEPEPGMADAEAPVVATEAKITPKAVVKATAPKAPANDAADAAVETGAEAKAEAEAVEAKGPEKTLIFGRKDPVTEASVDGPAPRSIFAGMQRPSNSAAATG